MNKIISGLILTLFIFSCSSQTAQKESKVEIVNAKEFQEKINKDPEGIILDVRTADEYNAGHIENAINIDFFSSSFKKEVQQLSREKTIYVYCAKGGRSHKASMILKEFNFSVIYDLNGGYSAWPYK